MSNISANFSLRINSPGLGGIVPAGITSKPNSLLCKIISSNVQSPIRQLVTPIDASTPVAVGQYVSADGTYKMKASATAPADAKFVGIVETVEETTEE